MTKILIRILFLAVVLGGGIYVADQNKSTKDELNNKKEQLQGSVKGITDNISDQTQELTSRGQEVSEHVSNILESYIKPSEEKDSTDNNQNSSQENGSDEDKPIYEETLDYGRYLYCQQVIKDYENQHP